MGLAWPTGCTADEVGPGLRQLHDVASPQIVWAEWGQACFRPEPAKQVVDGQLRQQPVGQHPPTRGHQQPRPKGASRVWLFSGRSPWKSHTREEVGPPPSVGLGREALSWIGGIVYWCLEGS